MFPYQEYSNHLYDTDNDEIPIRNSIYNSDVCVSLIGITYYPYIHDFEILIFYF